jgi:cytochrome c-type biogenesis protein CcmH
VLALAAALPGCDRNTEPFVPGEGPRPPDLSRIFPDVDEQGRPIAFPESAGLEEPDPMAPQRGAAPVAARAEPIRGTVRIAPDLEGEAPPGAVLFVIARTAGAQGGPPLAVKRLPAADLPVEFSVGPDEVMVPTFEFAGEIRLEARLDRDGTAAPQPGDLVGAAPGTYAPGADDVTIVLDRKL